MVSIIVRVYNAQRCLENCVQSILAQTYRDFQLILVNDGSTDESGNLCDGFAALDSRVTVIHQKNAGVSAARNAGLAVASGVNLLSLKLLLIIFLFWTASPVASHLIGRLELTTNEELDREVKLWKR